MSKPTCITCGCSVEALYKKYNSDVLKLLHCKSCNKTADKYIEYDTVIIVIDLILFKQEPYRHILNNTYFNNHWKMLVVTFLLKTYIEWTALRTSHNGQHQHQSFSKSEYDFYRSAAVTATSYCAFYLPVLLGLKLYDMFDERAVSSKQLIQLGKALILSEFGVFLLLPSLIWTEVQSNVHFAIVLVYVLVSRVQSLSVVTSCSRLNLFLLLVISLYCESLFTRATRDFLHH